jgi:amidohydrolase
MLERAKLLQMKIQSIRRSIHMNPELAFCEFETADLIKTELEAYGIPFTSHVARTGIVGDIGTAGPAIALRADMDALPIQEESSADYASRKKGIMHACGHDAHVACLLGAAEILSKMELPGRVRLIFQPAEESVDDEGKGGAVRMLEEDVLNGIGAIISFHVDASALPGTVKISEGPVSASMDEFKMMINGVGCHAAYPHRGVDPIYISSQVLNYLYSVVSRNINPVKRALISVGMIRGGETANIIPSQVELQGTIRAYLGDVREKIFENIRSVSKLVEGLGGTCEVRITDSIPVTTNDSALVQMMKDEVEKMLGESALKPLEPEMGSEDFGVYLKNIPGAVFHLGTAHEDESHRIHHNPKFDIDDSILYVGSAILAGSCVRWLNANIGSCP